MNYSGLKSNYSVHNGMAAVRCASWYAGAVNCGHQFGIHTDYSRKASPLYVDEGASVAWPFELKHAHTPVNNTDTMEDK
jgi:hypothetical protein